MRRNTTSMGQDSKRLGGATYLGGLLPPFNASPYTGIPHAVPSTKPSRLITVEIVSGSGVFLIHRRVALTHGKCRRPNSGGCLTGTAASFPVVSRSLWVVTHRRDSVPGELDGLLPSHRIS
jgi:hypothetical protein